MKKLLIIFTLLSFTLISAQEIEFGKVSKKELEEKFHPLDSTADAAYLLKKRRTYFQYDTDDGFVVVTEYHDRIKIYNADGFNYATKKINYYKPKSGAKEEAHLIKAYTFNIENNKVVKTKLSKKNIFDEKLNKYRSQKKITFPSIKEGSVIDLKYTLTSPYWDIKTLYFQYGIPVKNLQYKVEIPEYFIFNKTSRGYYNIPIEKLSKNRTIRYSYRQRDNSHAVKTTRYDESVNLIEQAFIFNQNNIPAVKENEPYSGNINNYKGGVEFELSGTRFPNSMYKNYTTSWENVCKTISKSSNFGGEISKKNYYKNDLNTLISAAKNNSEKILAIYNFVKSKVKWNEYYAKYSEKGVKKAYKEGSGNSAEINFILTSMLRSAGLNANPVLISTKNNGIPLFPTRDGFNYVITKVNLTNGKYILLDATEQYSYVNTLPYRTLNWSGREILENGVSNEVILTPKDHSKENNILNIKINDLGEVTGMLRKSLTRHSAMFYRQKNNIKKEEDVINDLEDKHSIEIENFKVFNSENLSKPITQTIKFTSEDFIEEINGKLYFSPLFFLATKENPFKSAERNFPVDYAMPWQDNFSVAISFPESYTVASFPEDLAVGLPDNLGAFKFKTTIQGNKIKLSSVLQINNNIIAPQFYSALKEFYKQLVEKQTEKIVLIKK